MFEIKNVSREAIEIVTTIDATTRGCRVKPVDLPPRRLDPGQTEVTLGYEPGVSFIVRPVAEPDRPRGPF